MNAANRDPLLLTPGPLTTAKETKQAMLHDWGSRDQKFIDATRDVRERIVELADGGREFTTVPVQGSGTFAVEAMVGTFLPRDCKLLIIVNGAYGHRIANICDYLNRAYVITETPEDTPPDPDVVAAILDEDPAISHVVVVHCETTSGILNPLQEIADVVAKSDRRLMIDAMSAFGAIPFSLSDVTCDVLAASSNKCLEGVPGMSFVLCRKTALSETKGNAHSLSLDLFDQWKAMEANGQWRFTPPTHVIFALKQALETHAAEGGVEARYRRYTNNCNTLIDGMHELGFETLLPHNLQAPIIVTFRMPIDPKFEFQVFYDQLKEKGFVIYPGKLTIADSFRMGCIGALTGRDIKAAVAAVGKTMSEMGVTSGKAA